MDQTLDTADAKGLIGAALNAGGVAHLDRWPKRVANRTQSAAESRRRRWESKNSWTRKSRSQRLLTMQAHFFGEDHRRLFGLFHAAQRQASNPERPPVLICGPHGQEAVRSHRLLKVLADRLSRAGHDVLRFDPYGSGDSAGDDSDLDLMGWRQDVVGAALQLQRLSCARGQLWIGFRLGATVACQALASEASVVPSKLLLVEPVGDGPQYLTYLAQATVQTLEASMSIKNPCWRKNLSEDPHTWQTEAAGFPLGARLHEQLQRLRVQDLKLATGVPTQVIVPTESLRQQVQNWPWSGGPGRLAAVTTPYDFDWTSEEALNSAWVPHGLVADLVASAASCLPDKAVPMS
jgi:uncharacterized protein